MPKSNTFITLLIIGMLGYAPVAVSQAATTLSTDQEVIFTPYSETALTSTDFDYYGKKKTINGVPYTGVVIDLHPNGKKKSRYSLKDGLAQGVWMDWHEDGSLSYYGIWKNGEGNGPFLYFYPNGELRERTGSVGNVWSGPSEGWNEDGSKAFESFYDNGKSTMKRKFPSD